MSFQIETERLILRDVREEDIPILIAQSAEPEAKGSILSYQSDETYNKKNLEKAIAWAKVPERQYYELSVILKDDCALIGSCAIVKVVPEGIETSIGWHFGHKYRGNGYATEAARQLLYIGFELNEVNSIYADCFADNKASIRIMEKIGMRAQWDFNIFNKIRGLSYGESKSTVRFIITRNQWLNS